MAAVTRKSDSFAPPYREGGSYWAACMALKRLGMGKMHPAAKLVAEYRKVVGPAAWKAFAGKEARNADTHKSPEDRVIVNAIVVNRADYGLPLRKSGMEVRKNRQDGGYRFGLFRLSPAEVKAAQHETVVRNGGKPSQKPQGEPKANRKGRKPTPKAAKPQKARKASKGKAK